MFENLPQIVAMLAMGLPATVIATVAGLLPTDELGNLHDLYNVANDGIQLQFLPEELMFAPDPVPHL